MVIKTDPVPKYNNPFEFDILMMEPVHHMMMKGIRIDQEKKKEFQQREIDAWYGDQAFLDKVVGMKENDTFNVESKKLVPWYLYTHLGLPRRTKKNKQTGKITLRSDEAALRAIMAECRDKVDTLKTDSAKQRWMRGYVVCSYILKVRSRRTRISRYLGMKIEKGQLKGPKPFEDEDGRLRGTVSVGGTETARFSHSKTPWGTGINMATNPREVRGMYIPDDGKIMIEFDLNRGESWVYAHLSQDPELLRIHHDGLDFHSETAATISSVFGEPREVEWIIEHKHGDGYRIRYLGKRTNHATSYRMKAFKGAEMINAEAEETGITVTVREFNKARNLWLQRYHYIPEHWWKEIERQLERTKTMVTPYGRIHQFHDFWGEELFKAATAYVPQSTSVDYINRGLLRVYHKFVKPRAWGLDLLAQSHDSILVQVNEDDVDEAIPEIASTLESKLVINNIEFTIPVEAKYGTSWADEDCKDYKLAA